MPTENQTTVPSLYAVWEQVPDPRDRRGRRQPLPAMLSLACVALLCGRQTILGIAQWVDDYGREYLKRFGFTQSRPPGQATWYRVLGQIDWGALEAQLAEWSQQVLERLGGAGARQGMSIDGKTLRGSKHQGAQDAHLLSAVAHRLAITLTQVAVADKTNEIPTVIELLSRLTVEGYVLTMDALLTQREIAEAIVARKGDYVSIVKRNQPRLREDIALLFTAPPPRARGDIWPTATSRGFGHGRLEVRKLQATTALNDYLDWPGVQQVFRLERHRLNKKRGTRTTEIVYGITSLAPAQASPEELLTLVRQHWTIENRVHWVRDVVFDEDRAQTRQGYLPHVMASLRNTVITLTRAHGFRDIARARRCFAARPDQALALALPTGQ